MQDGINESDSPQKIEGARGTDSSVPVVREQSLAFARLQMNHLSIRIECAGHLNFSPYVLAHLVLVIDIVCSAGCGVLQYVFVAGLHDHAREGLDSLRLSSLGTRLPRLLCGWCGLLRLLGLLSRWVFLPRLLGRLLPLRLLRLCSGIHRRTGSLLCVESGTHYRHPENQQPYGK